MLTPIIDLLKDDSDLTMHSHTEADLGVTLDTRYIKVAGGNSASNIIIENDTLDGDITFKVNDGGVDKTVMALDGATGNVGIGTTSPSHQLHLYSGTDNDQFAIQNTSATGFANFWVQGTGRTWQIGTAGASESVYGVPNKFFVYDRNVGGSAGMRMVIDTSGNVGIGTTAPTNILSLGGNSARTFWMERSTTANTAGNTLTITAGGATSGATDKNGGNLLLQGGLSTGTGESGVSIYGCVAGASGTSDRTQTIAIQTLGNKIGFFAGTPIVQQSFIAYTADNESSAYTGIDNAQAGTVYAQLTDLNALRTAYENLRAAYEDLKTKLVATTLVTSA